MAYTVKCPICGKLKHIYRKMQKAFYCCSATHIIADNLIIESWKRGDKIGKRSIKRRVGRIPEMETIKIKFI